MDITKITRDDPRYPPLLSKIIDPPQELFVRGNIELLSSACFSVVGSRDITDYGRRAIQDVVTPIAAHFTIVSGMALGADACAHIAALEARRPTIAVLGGGVDDECVYPRSHISLAHRILHSGGCLVSEYPPGEQPRPYYFPARNRIVVGLSLGVLIAEAAQKSGTMITARLALDYNRDVFAIPGSIFSTLSRGTNELIQQGAAMVLSARDVLSVYNIESSNGASAGYALSKTERLIFDLVAKNPCSLAEIVALSGCPVQEVMITVSELELRGVLKRVGGQLSGGL